LTKRGKNFGGWKTRYFVLNGPVLRYYEAKDGHHLGSIRLTDAQIGRQQSNTTHEPHDSSSNAYRHAFLILEPKKSATNGIARHVLCADSDLERDEWVEALIQYIGVKEESVSSATPRTSRDREDRKKTTKKIRKVSKDEIVPISAAPMSQLMLERNEKLMFPPGPHRSPSDSSLLRDDASSPKTPTPGTPSTPNDSLSSSIPTNSPLAQTASSDQHRASLDQNYSYFTHTSKTITRRSSMIHLSGRDGDTPPQNESRSETSSPVAGGKSSSEQAGEELEASLAEKKAKQKSNRMTFWGKKMFNNSNTDPYASNGTSLGTGPRPSTSTSTSTPSPAQSSSGLRGFLTRSSNDSPTDRASHQDRRKKGGEEAVKRPAKQVFGVPLEAAVRVSPAAEGYDLPSVVFRCIEYLDAKDAASEEGIYRLSGSSTVIKGLKEKFNNGEVSFNQAAEKKLG
jgi:RalA-binding protein 1